MSYNTELYHFGIKGQKWGVRRYQKKDGSLTNAGKKRYNDDNSNEPKKSNHRTRLEESYRSKGMTQRQAEEAAAKRIKIEKVVAITAAVTVAAASAYVINKNVKERTDKIIKSGTKLQRITADPTFDPSSNFYAAYKNSDKTKYKGMYGMQLKSSTKVKVSKVTLNADKDVKVVSRKKAADTFADLYKNDSDFREAFKRSNVKLDTQGMVPKRDKIVRTAGKQMTDKQLKRAGYDAFNIGLANHDADGNTIAKKFYDKLREQGYDAVADINDQKYSGYKSKAPLIIFNAKKKLSVADVKEMTDEQIASNAKKAYFQLAAPAVAKTGAVYGGTIMGGRWASKKVSTVRAVNDYKAQHPNTKLTDAEIEQLLEKQ